MSMTNEEAIYWLDSGWRQSLEGKYRETFDMAIRVLRHQIWEEKLWHDAKTDPPKTPGLYYGKKDDTNSMYPCLYRDGIWVLDAYPQTKMDIVKWADYTAFVKEDD